MAAAAASRRCRRGAGLGCKRGSTLEKSRDGRQSAAGMRPPGGTLEFSGDLLVGNDGRLCPVPGAPVRVEFWIGRLRKGAVDGASVAQPGSPVDG